jgi:hypothetical protein
MSHKVYACKCGYQVSPLAGTIFHKAKKPLIIWFKAILIMSKSNVTARELERQLGISYKSARHMVKQIKLLMLDKDEHIKISTLKRKIKAMEAGK